MNRDYVAHLQGLKAEGAKILLNLTCRATQETATGMSDEAYAWEQRLLKAVDPLGPARAADFTPLTPYRPRELEYLRSLDLDGVRGFSPYHAQAMGEHAVRMCRLDLLLSELPMTTPEYLDEALQEESQKLLLKESVEAAYAKRVEGNGGCPPTVKDDEKWRCVVGITRNRLRDLRRQHQTHKGARGGRPPEN